MCNHPVSEQLKDFFSPDLNKDIINRLGRPRNLESQTNKAALETFRKQPMDLISAIWKPRNTEALPLKGLPTLYNNRHNRTSMT